MWNSQIPYSNSKFHVYSLGNKCGKFNLSIYEPPSQKLLAMSSPKPHISSPTSIARIPHPIANFHRQNSTSHRQLPSPEFHISSPTSIARIPHLIAKLHRQNSTSHLHRRARCNIPNLHRRKFFVIANLRCCHLQTATSSSPNWVVTIYRTLFSHAYYCCELSKHGC